MSLSDSLPVNREDDLPPSTDAVAESGDTAAGPATFLPLPDIFENEERAEQNRSLVINLSQFTNTELPPQVDLFSYSGDAVAPEEKVVEPDEATTACASTSERVRPFQSGSVIRGDAQGQILLRYRPRQAKLILLTILAFFPIWALWLPYAIFCFAALIMQGKGDELAMVYCGLSSTIFACTIAQLAACLDTRLRIDSKGISLPLCFLPALGPGRKLPWSQLQSVVYRADDENALNNKLILHFGAVSVPLTIGGLSKEDLRKLVFAAQTHCVGERQKSLAEPSFTDIWESELSYRFSPTVFVPLQPGTRLFNGRIEILGESASGGLAAVYLACFDGERRVIVKELVLPPASDEALHAKALELFVREAEILKALDHPNVAKVLEHFSENGRHYLVLEHISGVDLRRFIRDNGRQHEEIVLRWALDLGDILEYLHGRTPPIVHRDISPDNLLFTGTGRIAVIDFGAASNFLSDATGTLIGKQNYMAPEQFRGRAIPPSDIYALGAVLHFLLTGIEPEPLSSSSPRESNAEVSEATDRLVSACTAVELSDRIESVAVLTSRLRGILNARRSSLRAGL